MGVGRGAWPPWIYIHDTDIVHRGLTVLFFGLFLLFFGLFSVALLLEIFLPTPFVRVKVKLRLTEIHFRKISIRSDSDKCTRTLKQGKKE